MLIIGLTGGIGSGKSTAAALLAARGAIVVDADRIAREVVGPDTEGLAAVVGAFGPEVLAGAGRLDRRALGAIVFADPARRRELEAITHPMIRRRTRELIAAAPADAIVVHDIPLLVETGVAPTYHLVVSVDADEDVRVRRLVGLRGLSGTDARARIAQQASRTERLAVSDVVLDNNGTPDDLAAAVDLLWVRLAEFEGRLRERHPFRPADAGGPVPYDPSWPAQAARALARLRHRLGPLLGEGATYDHVGATAEVGAAAVDLLDLRVGLPTAADADRPDVRAALDGLGHPPGDRGEAERWWCDPGRPAIVRLAAAEARTGGSAHAGRS